MAVRIKRGQQISSLVIHDVISTGGMSTVVKAVTPDGREIALKIAKPDPPGDPYYSRMLNDEVDVLKQLELPGVIRILPMIWERRSNAYTAVALELRGSPRYYAMELLYGPSLENYLKRVKVVTPGEAAAIGFEVAKILHRIHLKGFVHNDIKIDNIVFRRPLSIKSPFRSTLIDFGVTEKQKHKSFEGLAPSYAAPEKLEVAQGSKPPEYIEDSTKTDMWSVGVVLYQALTGKLPFNGKNNIKSVLTSIRRRQIKEIRSRQPDIPPELEELIIADCFAENPHDRPTAKTLAIKLAPLASRDGVQKLQRKRLFSRK